MLTAYIKNRKCGIIIVYNLLLGIEIVVERHLIPNYVKGALCAFRLVRHVHSAHVLIMIFMLLL